MNNVSHKKGQNSGTNPAHVESLPISLMKGACNDKPEKYFVKLKFCGYPTFITLDLYEFKMSLFDHGEL